MSKAQAEACFLYYVLLIIVLCILTSVFFFFPQIEVIIHILLSRFIHFPVELQLGNHLMKLWKLSNQVTNYIFE